MSLYRTFAALVALLLALSICPPAVSSQDIQQALDSSLASGRIDAALFGNMSLMPDSETYLVTVRLKEEPAQARALSRLSEESLPIEAQQAQRLDILKRYVLKSQQRVLPNLGPDEFRLRHRLQLVNAFSGQVTKKGLVKLLSDPNVESVESVASAKLDLSISVPMINVTYAGVWGTQVNGVNITGAGQTVCIIDTGVDYTHPSLGGCTSEQFLAGTCAKVPWGYDFQNDLGGEDADPMDGDGHGTHVAGIVASEHSTYRGVAPGAKIVSMKVFNSAGEGGSYADIAAAIDRCTTNRSLFNISVITMSLGGGVSPSCNLASCDSPVGDGGTAAEMLQAYNQGIFIDVSSGNDATTSSISFPACNRNAVSVGAVYDYAWGAEYWNGCTDLSRDVNPDNVTCFSNRCSILDVWAPGAEIVSTYPGSNFAYMSGTSMAAPHVAGAAALIQQYAYLMNDSLLPPIRLRLALNSTGKSVTRTVTKPRIDVYRAIRYFNFTRPPTLSGSIVSPLGGNSSNLFNFTVTYADRLNLTPSYVRAYVDGSPHEMSSNGSVNYLSGVLYYYNTTLTVGAHSYYFNASNGFFTNQTATVSNSPFVNRPPSLSALVTPSLGSSADLFNFTTTYTDADADQPLSIGIVLDGAPKGLQRMGSDYVSGVLYYYNATGLTKGQHSFYFNATDGNYTVSSAAGTGPRIFETAPSCDGASVAEDDWNVNVYSNCTNTAVLPTSSRAGRLLVSGANTLNLTDSQVFLNNSMMQLDGLLLLRQSGLTFVR